MKKIVTIILIAVAAIVTSCTDNLELDTSYDGEVRITSGIGTRVIGTMWEANDAIGVYMSNVGGSIGLLGANVKYITSIGDGNFTSTDPLYFPVSGNVDFLAYYPYIDDATFDATAYNVNVSSQNDMPAIDLMKATAYDVVNNSSAVNLTFKHKLSNIRLTVSPGDDWSATDLEGLTVKLVGTDTEAMYNLESDKITLAGYVADITLSTADNGQSAEGIVIPQTLTDARFSFATVANGTFELSIPIAAFASGYQYTYDVTIDATGAIFTNSTDDTWEDDDDIVATDAVYILGEATVYQSLSDIGVEAAAMAAGINEVDGTERSGMYEKYMLLEGGKEFQIVIKEGTTETAYGADLVSVDLDGFEDQPTLTVQKGVMTKNATLTVPADGLYHIIVDLNHDALLSNQPIVIAPVTWGVRGGMNSWGSTEGTATAFNKTTMTFTWTEQSLFAGASFKFAYGGGWKIQLDEDGLVKANTNLGADMIPGGSDLSVESDNNYYYSNYTITLTYTLAAGAIADNYSYTTELTSFVSVPPAMYMIGFDFGYWDWDSDEIVEMIPVNGVNGAFWTIQYFMAGSEHGFKFCPNREWNADFTNLGTDTGYTIADGNCNVDADGLYMVYIDYVNERVAIEPAAVYGIGDAFGDYNYTEEYSAALFTANGKTLTATTTGAGNLRMYAASSISTSDWWTREFNIFDGVVVFRGTDGDQDYVPVTAGQTVTLDFSVANAATGSIN